jgi:hypothetical protein
MLAPCANAQEERQPDQARSVFVEQAPENASRQAQQSAQRVSSVYFPDEITPESVARARAQAAQPQQVGGQARGGVPVTQVTSGGQGARDIAQLSDGDSDRVLAQLSAAERQVLLEAVEGTDICERNPEIPALKALCEGRIETRSAEFARSSDADTAEGAILGEGLDSNRVATLESAIRRLAQNSGQSGDFSEQVIASVAINNRALGDSEAAVAEGDPGSNLSPETQAVVNAIVQQFRGGR